MSDNNRKKFTLSFSSETTGKNNNLLPIKAMPKCFMNKTADLTLSNTHVPKVASTPKTNLEKVIETLYDISHEFQNANNPEYSNKTKWAIKEILANKMYKYETKSENSKEENKLLQLYSPGFNEDEEISLENKSLKETVKEYEDDTLHDNPNEGDKFIISIKSPNKIPAMTLPLFKPIDLHSFGVEFDVFTYAEKIGREHLMSHIFKSIMIYKDCISLLKTSFIDSFIEELRKGYTQEKGAYYHNVSL